MINSEMAVEILEIQLKNIEFAGHQLAIATHECEHKLIGEEKKSSRSNIAYKQCSQYCS